MRPARWLELRQLLRAGAVVLVALIPCALTVPAERLLATSLWLSGEALITIATAYLIALVTTFRTSTRVDKWLDLSVSRGLEVVAALPLVLTSAIIVEVGRLPVPLAIAVVTGTLGGLRSAHVVLSVKTRCGGAQQDREGSTHGQKLSHRLALTATPRLVEQLIGLEAAFTWLDIQGQTWTGGWGECLGRAARRGELATLAAWTMAAVGLSVGLKLITRPKCTGDDQAKELGLSIPPTV